MPTRSSTSAANWRPRCASTPRPARSLDFRVGVADSVAKTVVYRLLEPALQLPDPVRMVCSEGTFAELLGQLALRRSTW
jgi:hypothetical protein